MNKYKNAFLSTLQKAETCHIKTVLQNNNIQASNECHYLRQTYLESMATDANFGIV
jgi:hypothetical protein